MMFIFTANDLIDLVGFKIETTDFKENQIKSYDLKGN